MRKRRFRSVHTMRTHTSSWRDYQKRLKKKNLKERIFGIRISRYVVAVCFIAAIIYGFSGGSGEAVYHPKSRVDISGEESPAVKKVVSLSQDEIRNLMDGVSLVNARKKNFEIITPEDQYRLETTLDMSLQNFLVNTLKTDYARYIAIVAMEARTGRILGMAGYDREDPDNNPCINENFPAASIIKILSAAAAVEKCGFLPGSSIRFSGRKYTLYKFQLKKDTNRWTRNLTFEESFAQSVNPVFGKIGIHYVGKEGLEKYADAFGFNRPIQSEIPIVSSRLSVSEDPYHWAEIACGFNRTTTISAIHGAMIVSAVINDGNMMQPHLIDRVLDVENRSVYEGQPAIWNSTVTPKSSAILRRLMKATITEGTCRKTFRGVQKDPVLSRLDIGGKTGSISSRENRDFRYDWFVGFANEKITPGTINQKDASGCKDRPQFVISSIVVHDKLIGVRAKDYAKMAMTQYFKNHFNKKKETEAHHAGL